MKYQDIVGTTDWFQACEEYLSYRLALIMARHEAMWTYQSCGFYLYSTSDDSMTLEEYCVARCCVDDTGN